MPLEAAWIVWMPLLMPSRRLEIPVEREFSD